MPRRPRLCTHQLHGSQHTRIERRRISAWTSPVIALAIDDDTNTLSVLTNDGSVRLISTTSWELIREISQIVPLPAIVRQWSQSRFWTLYFLHFDPLHVNFDLVGGSVFAGASIIDAANCRVTHALPNISM